MSWNGSGDERFGSGDEDFDRDHEAWEESDGRRWPLHWRGLYPRERWLWFEQLWTDVCALRERYRLSVRSDKHRYGTGWRLHARTGDPEMVVTIEPDPSKGLSGARSDRHR